MRYAPGDVIQFHGRLASYAKMEKRKSKSDLAVLNFLNIDFTSTAAKMSLLPTTHPWHFPVPVSKRKFFKCWSFKSVARESHLGNHEVSFTSRCSDTHIQLVFNAKHYKKDSRSLQFVRDMYIFDKQIDRQAAIATAISQRCCTFSSSRDVWSPPFPNRTPSLPVVLTSESRWCPPFRLQHWGRPKGCSVWNCRK